MIFFISLLFLWLTVTLFLSLLLSESLSLLLQHLRFYGWLLLAVHIPRTCLLLSSPPSLNQQFNSPPPYTPYLTSFDSSPLNTFFSPISPSLSKSVRVVTPPTPTLAFNSFLFLFSPQPFLPFFFFIYCLSLFLALYTFWTPPASIPPPTHTTGSRNKSLVERTSLGQTHAHTHVLFNVLCVCPLYN